MLDGLRIAGPRGPIRIKWHRLRRVAGDIDFTARRLREGLALGASMEIDLRRHAGHGFVCLHDSELESETNGRGAISAASVDQLRRLRMRAPGGSISGEPLLLLDDLVEISAAAHPQAVVQFDIKERFDNLDGATVDTFVRLVRPRAERFLVSGDDWEAVRLLGARVPGLQLGYDPCDLPEARRLRTEKDFADFTRLTLDRAPSAVIIYLEYTLALAALDAGFNIVAALQAAGREVDAWTLDVTAPNAPQSLARLIECGVDQISSNDSVALQELAQSLGAPAH